MQISIGDIYWLNINEDIPHPHVIVEVLLETNKVKLCGITTNANKASMPGNVVLEIGEANLNKKSIVEVYKTVSIELSELKEFIGRLNQERVEEIKRGIQFINNSYLNSKQNQ